MSFLPVVVVGAGISGLTTAFELERAGQRTVVLEADVRLGGSIRTEAHDGFLYDVGADSFLHTKPEASALCRELGLEADLVKPLPATTAVFVARDGALYPMPPGLSLGVPTHLGALLDTPLLSDLGKARAACEPLVPRRRDRGEESILGFLERRLGTEMAERLAGPLLSGVFAGDGRKLSIDAAFPQFVESEKRHGSLFVGLSGQSSLWSALTHARKPPGSPFLSLRGGLGQLISTLYDRLPLGTVRLGSPVTSIESRGATVRVCTLTDVVEARHVVVTGSPWVGAGLLGDAAPRLAQLLSRVNGAPTATVFLGLDQGGLERELAGSGFIVPPGEGDILAATYVSSKWAGRAPPGGALVRAFLGGARHVGPNILSATDEELIEVAHSELQRFMGGLGPVRFARVYRYARGNPQPELGQLQLMREVDCELSGLPWLSLTGPGFRGVGIPDCVRGAQATAARLLASFSS